MKRITVLLLSIVLAASIQGQQKITLEPAIEFGYEDRGLQFVHESFPYLNNTFFGDIEAAVRYQGIKIHTDVKTFFIPLAIDNYKPLQTEYSIGMSYEYKYFTLAYYHMCSHSNDALIFRESINRVSLKIKLYKPADL